MAKVRFCGRIGLVNEESTRDLASPEVLTYKVVSEYRMICAELPSANPFEHRVMISRLMLSDQMGSTSGLQFGLLNACRGERRVGWGIVSSDRGWKAAIRQVELGGASGKGGADLLR
jgi:hypothetical protein